MRKTIHYCDLCYIDGDENVKAIASYTAPGDGEDYDICRKHKKMVEDAGVKTYDL